MSDTQNQASVLLATRSPATAKLIGKQLREHYTLWHAEEAEQAWSELTDQRAIALVICELELALDRFGLLERIRNAGDTRLAATPVLLLLGENESESRQETAFQRGASDFINLPFSSTELFARVRLHTNLFLQHSLGPQAGTPEVAAVGSLKQLSQQNFFTTRVQQELSFSARHHSPLSLCQLKLDDVKGIIDEFDKATAISVVQAVARVMQQTMRREDTMCYLGNAEFFVLYPATNGIGATAGIRRILDGVAGRSLRLGDQRVSVTLSAAIYSAVATDATDFEQIRSRLAACLKAAVAQGPGRIESCNRGEEPVYDSVDRALDLIAAGQGEQLRPRSAALVERILPLLEFADAALPADCGGLARELRERLGAVATE